MPVHYFKLDICIHLYFKSWFIYHMVSAEFSAQQKCLTL